MMANYRVIVIAFSVLVCNNISLVQCNECKTNEDCKYSYYQTKCCGDSYFNSKIDTAQRSCTYGDSCLNHYCSSDSDCSDSSLCCRSNQCVKDGCSGCTRNVDCDRSLSHVCCKKTFSSDQTVCAANCINEDCNSNDDCAGYGECCRSGKCTSTGCSDKCKSNSECNSDEYCCKKADTTNSWGWNKDIGCVQTCVDKLCSTSDDCGPDNECCISNKCVDRGCSGCTTNSNCSFGQYCCKKKHLYEVSECSADCIGKSCGTSDDCGGPDETCDSDHRCTNKTFPSWVIAVITASLVVFLIAVGVILVVVWNIKRKRAANASQTGTVPLLNTRYQGQGVQAPQPNTQFSGITNPTYHETTSQNQPGQIQQTNNAAYQPPNSTYYPQESQNGAQNQFHNPQLNYQPLETPSAPQDTSAAQQMYPQNTPYQGNNYPPPAYSSLVHGNH